MNRFGLNPLRRWACTAVACQAQDKSATQRLGPLHALSIDLEEWYHSELVRKAVPRAARRSQIEEATRPILNLLDEAKVKATFFVVGEVAREHPHLIREIASKGHEIGCHGMTHRPLWEMDEGELSRELEEFARLMEGVLGHCPVTGFRAPTFSLDHRTRWAVDVLASFGYRYDASVFPMRTPLYGVPDAPARPYRLSSTDVASEDPEGALLEFPATVYRLGRFGIPVGGGFYLRALPLSLLSFLLRRVAKRGPFVIYIHPWETFVGTVRWPQPWPKRFVTHYNAGSALCKLKGLLGAFSFGPLRDVLSLWEGRKANLQ